MLSLIWNLVGILVGFLVLSIQLIVSTLFILAIVLIVMTMLAIIKGDASKIESVIDKIAERIKKAFE